MRFVFHIVLLSSTQCFVGYSSFDFDEVDDFVEQRTDLHEHPMGIDFLLLYWPLLIRHRHCESFVFAHLLKTLDEVDDGGDGRLVQVKMKKSHLLPTNCKE